MANLNEVSIVLKYLADVFVTREGEKITVDKAKAYHRVLQDIPRLQLVDTATAWVSSEKWFPKPAELLELSKKFSKPFGDPTTESAWWFAFAHGYESTDDFTDEDVKKIYAAADVAMVEAIK